MITQARPSDYDFLCSVDRHISKERLKKKIEDGEVLVLLDQDKIVGWLRYSFFWDEHPFMNLVYILDGFRGMGHGKKLVGYWEDLMFLNGHKLVMTSTLSNEHAQHFYRNLRYRDIGGFIMPQEPLEIMLIKEIKP